MEISLRRKYSPFGLAEYFKHPLVCFVLVLTTTGLGSLLLAKLDEGQGTTFYFLVTGLAFLGLIFFCLLVLYLALRLCANFEIEGGSSHEALIMADTCFEQLRERTANLEDTAWQIYEWREAYKEYLRQQGIEIYDNYVGEPPWIKVKGQWNGYPIGAKINFPASE